MTAAEMSGAPRAARDFASVLVIEDDPDIRESLSYLLEDEGLTVATAEHGEDALRYLRSHAPPHLILLDLMMPVMNGWELSERLGQDPQLDPIPVILLSGMDSLHQQVSNLRVDGYFRKPINCDHLVEVVKSYCH